VTKGTVYEDLGQVTVSLGQKDVTSPLSPNNYVTITRYHVDYVRSDGRNTQASTCRTPSTAA